eukprot:3838375-Pleurochrysis_carterae.AAC.1
MLPALNGQGLRVHYKDGHESLMAAKGKRWEETLQEAEAKQAASKFAESEERSCVSAAAPPPIGSRQPRDAP